MRMLLTDTTEHGSAPTPSEINLARFSLVAVLFVAQAACADAACFGRLGRRRGGDDRASLNSRGDAFGSTQSLLSAEEGAKGLSRKKLNRVLSLDAWMPAPPATGPKSSASSRNASLWGAACELAFWHFVTIAFQSTGVAYTGATRAGFIAASTTMMVPFVSTLAGEAVKSTTWIAACVAVCGTALIVFASDNARSEGDVVPTREEEEASYDVFFGDVLTLIGSVAWAFFTFRLSKLAPNVDPLKLAVARSFCMAGFVGVWFLVERLMSWSVVEDGGAVDDDGAGRRHETHGSWLASPNALCVDGVHGRRARLVVRVVANSRASVRARGARRRALGHDAVVGRGVGGGHHGRANGDNGVGRGSDRSRRHYARRAREVVGRAEKGFHPYSRRQSASSRTPLF
jgi:drug/metabolite transporter (DMT)-like permease